MFGWFRKKEEALLEFADNRAAFEYACMHLPNRILLEAVIPAIVEEEGQRGRDGERFVVRHRAATCHDHYRPMRRPVLWSED